MHETKTTFLYIALNIEHIEKHTFAVLYEAYCSLRKDILSDNCFLRKQYCRYELRKIYHLQPLNSADWF